MSRRRGMWSMTGIVFQPIRVDTSSQDEEGRLILADGRLVGVLVKLDGVEQGDLRGAWSLEAAFGPLEGCLPEPFSDLDQARVWAEGMIRPAN